MRSPTVAGTFYESDFSKLNDQLITLFNKGPGSTPLEKRDKKVLAAILPHSPYPSSGVCSAWAYKDIAETPLPSTYIILGTLHNVLSDKALLSLQDFITPFGMIKNDRNLANNLLDNNIKINESSHQKEHSIETQLPFLQFTNKKSLGTLRILPLLISTLDLTIIKQIAKKLANLDNVIYLASSDLIHYGPLYKFTFKYNAQQELENITNNILNSITNLKTQNFLSTLETSKAHICGASPIALLLEILKIKNIKKGKILCHYKDSKNEENFIDFVSITYNETQN